MKCYQAGWMKDDGGILDISFYGKELSKGGHTVPDERGLEIIHLLYGVIT